MTNTPSMDPPRGRPHLLGLAVTALAVSLIASLAVSSPSIAQAAPGDIGQEPYRQNLHYSPARNWVNDPNGMLYYKGTYHLFYQHNPSGIDWGNMSWGHATSTDLVSWVEKPVAIPNTETEFIFSGSAVIDWENTSGFGTADNPPMVAIYTSDYRGHPVHGDKEAQSLAYSLDEGETWTKYDGNPVDDRGRRDYRDPKVFWYGDKDTGYWVMAVVEADASRVILNRSADLKSWTYMSTFTSDSVGGFWECPDIYPIAVDGDASNTKWVLTLSTGARYQSYFTGDFDGTTFTEDPAPLVAVPSGTVLWDFEDGTYDGWTVVNDQTSDVAGPFGTAPAPGTLPHQRPVGGFAGDRMVNSYLGTDGPIGSMVSPEFTIDSTHLSFITGGGNHPRAEGTGSGLAPANSTVLFDFEAPTGTTLAEQGWTGTGGLNPSDQPAAAPRGENVATGLGGNGFLSTFYTPHGNDTATGSLTSPSFTIDSRFVNFKLGGGDGSDLAVQLLIDGVVEKSETGKRNHLTDWRAWDVSAFEGTQAQIRVVDNNLGGWGAIWIDDVVASPDTALPRSTETSVNLVVDGKTVRHTPGPDNETMNWENWDVTDLAGKTAHIEIIDNNRSGYGHIMADHFVAVGKATGPNTLVESLLDFGRDNYASITYNDVPDGKRVYVGWMGQAFASPTSPWRGSFTMPRELELKTIDGTPKLVHAFASQLTDYEKPFDAFTVAHTNVDGVVALPKASGTHQRIKLTIAAGDDVAGITVRGSDAEGTRIGYDPSNSTVFIDRTASGLLPSGHFSTPSRATVRQIDGKVTLDILVDTGSVEVLVNGGEQAFSEFIYPSADSDRVSLFSEGGEVAVTDLAVTPLYSGMYDDDQVWLTVPGAPTEASATSSTSGEAVVTWVAPADTGKADLTGFTVTANREDASRGARVAAGPGCTATAGATTCTITGLEPGAKYSFAVVATNKVGSSIASAPSNTVVIAGVPGVGTPSGERPGTPGGIATTGFLGGTLALLAALAIGTGLVLRKRQAGAKV